MKKNIKTKVAFWLLIIPYILMLTSFIAIWAQISGITSAIAFVLMLIFPILSTCSTIASIALQIIALCTHESKTKNIIMLVFSALTFLFIVFYVWLFLEIGASV